MGRDVISTTRLAAICGVSQGTVDRALNGRGGIAPETKQRILDAAREYGYRPNVHARCMAGGKSMMIGVAVFDLNNRYFSDLLTAIEGACAARGYVTTVMFTGRDPAREIECIERFYHIAVDGIALVPANKGVEYEQFLRSFDLPILTLGNRLGTIPHVGIDDGAAMRETTESVLKYGYDRLVYVKPRLLGRNASAQIARLASFLAVCRARGVEHVVTDLEGAERELLPGRRCALICPTDLFAVRLLDVAARRHAGVIGFDNVSLIEELGLRLDSVAFDPELVARLVVDGLISGRPSAATVPHRIVTRGSL